jgi:hypothetical protein
MEKIDEILESKDIKEVTRKQYRATLLKLNNFIEPTTLTFMTKGNAIKKILKNNAKSTQRSSYATLMSVISVLMKEDEKRWGKHYIYYKKILDKMNMELREDHSLSQKEEDAWISREELDSYMKKFIKNSKELSKKQELDTIEFRNLMRDTIASLYVLNPPRRNLDYQEMYVVIQFK